MVPSKPLYEAHNPRTLIKSTHTETSEITIIIQIKKETFNMKIKTNGKNTLPLICTDGEINIGERLKGIKCELDEIKRKYEEFLNPGMIVKLSFEGNTSDTYFTTIQSFIFNEFSYKLRINKLDQLHLQFSPEKYSSIDLGNIWKFLGMTLILEDSLSLKAQDVLKNYIKEKSWKSLNC